MLALLEQLRHKVAIGFVGGSDLAKQQEQLGSADANGLFAFNPLTSVIDMFDYSFSENGLTAYKLGTKLASQV